MTLLGLDHVNLRTARVAELTAFYCDVLGLRVGPRPAFAFGGAWLYCGERAVVHLVEVETTPEPGAELRLQHFAFRGSDLAPLLQRLEQAGLTPRLGVLPDFGICQLNVVDPDGNHLHLDYPLAEAVAAGLVASAPR
jgi:catechol 2,3-dioxygenase-like lactoylglutathione lyase family enzyme